MVQNSPLLLRFLFISNMLPEPSASSGTSARSEVYEEREDEWDKIRKKVDNEVK